MTIYNLFGEPLSKRDEAFATDVRIPAIQREYVQGRKDASGERARRDFLPTLVEVAKNSGTLNLHFMYGIVVKDARDRTFLPLDGQQRLTTLCLLAWYGRQMDLNSPWQLEYESRRAATYFLRGLFGEAPSNIDGDIVEFVCSRNWFMPVWLQDESVSGMLEMLKAIQKEVGDSQIDLHGIQFEVKELDVSDEAYEQIFLKMNARGKPLTSWECLKSVVDGGLTGEFEDKLKLNAPWRQLIDNDWCQGLWVFCDRDIDKLNVVFEKAVRMAWCAVSRGAADFASYQLRDWLRANADGVALLFYHELALYLNSLSTSGEIIASWWPVDRKCNALWRVTGETSEFKDWICKPLSRHMNANESAYVLRFVYLVHGCDLGGGDSSVPRRLRVLLNLLDATDVSYSDEEDKIGSFKSLCANGVSFIEGQIEQPTDLNCFDELQLQDEAAKWTCDADEVRKIELSPLVFQGSTKFIPGAVYKTARQLTEAVEGVGKRIKDDWLGFYAQILNGFKMDDARTFFEGGPIAIPHADSEETYWGEHILSSDRVALSVKAILTGGSSMKDFPIWLRHFVDIAKNSPAAMAELWTLRKTYGWLWLVKGTNRTDKAIRLDYSEPDARNRREILGVDYITYGDGSAQKLGRDGQFHDVYAETWWNS